MKQCNITTDQNPKNFNIFYVVKLPQFFPKMTSTTNMQFKIHIVFKGVNTKKGAKNHVIQW
jgi:hypothetical protein